ncbi:MAG: anthranilate synthase component I [Thaumarchaeota archaeon]|nr:anthranilate synthase component I [Nitrososphaerota archaeon]
MIVFGTVVTEVPLNLSARRLQVEQSPKDLFVKFLSEYPNCFLLESAKGKSRLAEYSFLGFDPVALISAKNGTMELENTRTGSSERLKTSDPFTELKRLVPPNSVSGLFRFIGGAVGFVSYDAVRYWERLPDTTTDDKGHPDLQFGVYEDGVVFDHARREAYYYSLGESRIDEVLRVSKKAVERTEVKASEPKSTVERQEFEGMVTRAKEHIVDGDIFQAVLSKRYDLDIEGDLSLFYETLSQINPSPYMYFLKFGDRRIVGSSPEMLVRVEDGRVETYPIAGTRPRVEDQEENMRLKRELLDDPKEAAEHVMLVDLARNDLGRVSKYGSVKVPELMTVEQYSHVQHIVSHVVGEMREGLDAYDALRAVFPAGTVSGAPKVRAMEIIEELERRRRGPYAGAVGYFSFNGNADFAITIRTLVSEGRSCSVQSGAGIVADSTPANEWKETEAKAEGLLTAMRAAEKEN